MTAKPKPWACMDSPRETWPKGSTTGLCDLHFLARTPTGCFFDDDEAALEAVRTGLACDGLVVHVEGASLDDLCVSVVRYEAEPMCVGDRTPSGYSAAQSWEFDHAEFRARVLEGFAAQGARLDAGDALDIAQEMISGVAQ